MLPRRTFLGLLAGFAGGILSLTRALGSPSWWRRPRRVQEQSATLSGNHSGIKFATRRNFRTVGDLSEPEVFYIQGEWRRFEFRGVRGRTRVYGPRIVTIVRPDLEQMFELNLDASEYAQWPYPPRLNSQPLTKEELAARGIRIPLPGEAVKLTFRIETVTKDTGERQEMFGYVARHVVTTQKEIPLEGSRRQAQEMTRDGWYINLEPQLYPTTSPYPPSPVGKPGESRRVHSFLSVSSHRPGEEPQVPEMPEFIDIGKPETGFALQELRTTMSTLRLPDGATRQIEDKAETLVTIEKGTYDAALFEVPSGFKRVPNINRNPA